MQGASPERWPAEHGRTWFVFGCALAVAVLLGLAESYLRWFPPRDLWPYLGDLSPLKGSYKADVNFGVAYRSWKEFQDENSERLQAVWPFPSHSASGPVWAFFGN